LAVISNLKKRLSLISRDKKIFRNQPYKLELLEEFKKQKKPLTIYRTLYGQKEVFVDLCAGPHVASTKIIDKESFKLEKLAGAYWKGDEKMRCSPEFTGWRFIPKKNLTIIYTCLRNQKNAIIELSVNKWIFLASMKNLVQVWFIGTPKAD